MSHRISRRHTVTLAALGSTLWIWSGCSRTPDTGAIPQGISAKAAAALTPATAGRGWNWPAGAAASYRIEQIIDIAGAGGTMSPDTTGRTTVSGMLHVCLAAAAGDRVTLAMQLSGVTCTSLAEGTSSVERAPVIEEMLNNSPCLLHLGRDGTLLSCELPAGLADDDRVMLEGLLGIEFVLRGGRSWTTDERAQGLAWQCRYTLRDDGEVTKTRRALPGAEGQPSQVTLTSAFTARAGDFWIESLSGGEQTECSYQGSRVCTASARMQMTRVLETAVPGSLRVLASSPASWKAFVSNAALDGSQPRAASARARQHQARLAARFAGVTCERMIADLDEAVQKDAGHAATIPAMHALRDWLLTKPGSSARLAGLLQDRSLSDALTARMVHALELAGRQIPEGQGALADILKAPPGSYSPGVLMQAAVAAGGTGRLLSPELLPALKAAAAGENPGEGFLLNDAALYAIGSLARDNAELRPDLVHSLSPSLSRDGSIAPDDTAAALRTLANAGIAETSLAAQALELMQHHPEPDVRQAAIDYLAATTPPEALPALAQTMTGDTSGAVRSRALEALTSPELASPGSLAPVLQLVADTAAAEPLRAQAVASLAPLQAAFPEIRGRFLQLLPGAGGEVAAQLREAVARPL